MKLKSIFSALALTAAVAVQPALAADKLSVAATPVPHAEILEHIKPALKDEGVDLDIAVFTDYVQPNQQVADGQIDANFFQHKPYLDSFNKERGTDLVSVALVHVEPFGAYSKKTDKIDDLKEGARVAIPNDPSNGARALLLLEKNGLIKLKDSDNLLATARDISENPKKLKFTELEAATLARVLDDVDLALINTNYAIEAGLNPLEDALIIEGSESPYANLVAVKAGNEKDPRVEKLIKALNSEDVKKFIEEEYKGAVVPAF
ncbi:MULTISPECIES: MetQ/NlpA family ABC transporter substrate-binding protein [Oligella]|uniref:Methionine ABC transporter substrate-binding protein n=1 Tax=Oligella urethralis DNF00040 TaxID=1401065 RepID=A0A096BA65_9BURK|nr:MULTISPECIES: MetQ/NlpA family ABC transporter substrate-binding protein [Oligella]KGF30089.1 methionine ABC transporter substrate-binding protein [Oligella urethralis DNF00040]OFV48785.1 methionine ABC transporter substrate-binding protein [Oligella sp. HMSC09E12]PMC17011.1 MetQ/NlpA family lipoprotein [Oligella urethralis]WOS38740.1 Membrane lipoprotein TpN32 [Oligella urethralis]